MKKFSEMYISYYKRLLKWSRVVYYSWKNMEEIVINDNNAITFS